MTESFHPRRGKGRLKSKQKEISEDKTESEEEEEESFDWDSEKNSKEFKKAKSALNFFLVLGSVNQTLPGSGAGLIPLSLPRREWRADQELTQLKSLQGEALVSCNNLIALFIYDIKISSDYRLFGKLFKFQSKIISLPVYLIIILSPSKHFLLLSPGTSFFPLPTFQNQNTNQFPSSIETKTIIPPSIEIELALFAQLALFA